MPTPTTSSSPPEPHRPLTDPALASIGRILGRSPHATRAGLLNNAEIVVWQSSRRLIIALSVGVIGVLLEATGLVHRPSWPFLVVIPAYIAIVALLTVSIERTHEVSRAALVVLALTDVAAIYVIVALVAAPVFYPRALLLSLLALRSPKCFRAVALHRGHIASVSRSRSARGSGVNVAWIEQAWFSRSISSWP